MATVLLVITDFDRAHQLRSALQRAGHTVFAEFHARDALRVIDRHIVNALVCDAVLPAMFGTDLIVTARAATQDPELPAILLDGLPAGLEYELFDAQPLQIVPRSASATELCQLIEQLCWQHGRRGPEWAPHAALPRSSFLKRGRHRAT